MVIFQVFLGLYFAFVSAYLSIVLSRLLRQNGKAIREQGNRLSNLIKEVSDKTSELIKTESQQTRELIKTLKG